MKEIVNLKLHCQDIGRSRRGLPPFPTQSSEWNATNTRALEEKNISQDMLTFGSVRKSEIQSREHVTDVKSFKPEARIAKPL